MSTPLHNPPALQRCIFLGVSALALSGCSQTREHAEDPAAVHAASSASMAFSERWETWPPKSDAYRRAEWIRAAAVAEAAQLGNHPWAGEYFLSGGAGYSGVGLAVSPRAGASWYEYGCQSRMAVSGEVIELDPRVIRLALPLDSDHTMFGKHLEAELVAVAWDRAHFFVPREELGAFVDGVNRGSINGWAWSQSRYFLRTPSTPPVQAKGLPELPEPFAASLFRRPVPLRILRVEPSEVREDAGERDPWTCTHVRVDKGWEDGLFLGMRVDTDERHPALLAVVRGIQPHEAEVQLLEWVAAGEHPHLPTKDWALMCFAPGPGQTAPSSQEP